MIGLDHPESETQCPLWLQVRSGSEMLRIMDVAKALKDGRRSQARSREGREQQVSPRDYQ